MDDERFKDFFGKFGNVFELNFYKVLGNSLMLVLVNILY